MTLFRLTKGPALVIILCAQFNVQHGGNDGKGIPVTQSWISKACCQGRCSLAFEDQQDLE